MTFQRFFSILILATLVLSLNPAGVGASAGVIDPAVAAAQQTLDQMSPEELVGQLFLVTFTGSVVDEEAPIYDLIASHHVGGVVLRAGNDNFVAAPDTISSAYQLIAQLQDIEWQNSTDASPETSSANYIPLFIGLSPDGQSANDQILAGLTPLPDLMAVGAIWDPTLAEQVGAVAGQELSGLGFNLFFGPSLDVLESPESTLGNGVGTNAFGGDPYWVGVMGSAYVSGLHTGSDNRLIVVADHFPGRGSSDRPEGEEPATVRKSLEELKQFELAPYLAVTGNALPGESTVDGLLVSHIRYQGFQGNIRSTTRPVSFDAQALSQILSLPVFADWRLAGGLLVSDDLGSQTVHSFYAPGEQTFFARIVARDAFLAGNDLLYMGNIVSSDMQDNYASIVNALEFFAQKYREDPAFAQRVDDSVYRILVAKYRLYASFDPESVTPSSDGLAVIGGAEAVTFDVASRSATLISPNLLDLETVLPSVPAFRDHVVFLTDVLMTNQCSTCTETPVLAVDALQNVILRLYGTQGGGQVMPGRLISYPLGSVSGLLEEGSGNAELETSLYQSSWVVISVLDAGPDESQMVLLRRFLSERQDLLRDKTVIVFAFGAPYYLDSTDISKLTAYYCLYSESEPFVEVAARLLFRELAPAGDLPVSVPGIDYDLLSATAPDPAQVIQLSLDLPPVPVSTGTPAADVTLTPSFRVGDTITVRTGTILDHNGHSVPDGTGVQFTVSLSGDAGVIQQLDVVTAGGVAAVSFSIERAGLIEVMAASEPAVTSVVLQLNVTGEGMTVTIVAPTPEVQMTPTPDAEVPVDVDTLSPLENGYPGFSGWFMMIVLLVGVGYLVFMIGNRHVTPRWGARWALCAVAGGVIAYSYLAFRMPGAAQFLKDTGLLGLMGVVLLGAAAGFGLALAWRLLARGSAKRPG